MRAYTENNVNAPHTTLWYGHIKLKNLMHMIENVTKTIKTALHC